MSPVTVRKWSSTVSHSAQAAHHAAPDRRQRLLAGNPPETWQTAQRPAALGYDWHNIMHMIARLVSDGIYQVMHEHRAFGPGD